MSDFSLDNFLTLLQTVTDKIKGDPLNQALEDKLNQDFPRDSDLFKAITASCHAGIVAGELCRQEAGGIRFGRVIKPCPELDDFSVDVVYMNDVVGPHHSHPGGEIDLIMPIDAGAKFDDHGAGWLVYGPDSAHCPTVSGGSAMVLYLLPKGDIKFTRH